MQQDTRCTFVHHISLSWGAVQLVFWGFIIFCALGSALDNDIEMHAPMGSVLLTLESAVLLIQMLN